MLNLAAGTRYFDSLDATRTAARSVDRRTLLDETDGQSIFAMSRLSDVAMLLRELGADCEISTMRTKSDDVREMLTSIADTCFVAQTELSALKGQLRHCESRPQLAAVVAESAHRKLRRIASRTQWLLAPLVGRSADVGEQEADLVKGSVIVRRLYSTFRKSLVQCTDDDVSVRPAMLSATAAISTLLRDSRAAELRVQDYQVLLELQERVDSWLRVNGTPTAARNIHADLSAFAELTRMVNQRQELRAHDAVMYRCVLRDAYPALQGDMAAREQLLDALESLEGADDTLDAIADCVRLEPNEAAFFDLRLHVRELIED